jgi:hypothetical protein
MDLETTVTENKETLRIWFIGEQQPQACVSIGHTDYRAIFYFTSDEEAVKCYDALSKTMEIIIE